MIIAGGGTGGHLFPGVAVAEAFLKKDPTNEVLFVGTGRPLEKKILHSYGFPYRTIRVEGIKGRGVRHVFKGLAKLPVSMVESVKILRNYRPHVVLGVGGYAAGPVVLMASVLRYPTAVAEQNALPGITNRILGRFVDRVFLSFPDDEGVFASQKVMVTGNPVRSNLIDEARAEEKRTDKRFHVFIFGGSQGARIINSTMLKALEYLNDLKDEIYFIHQTGEADFDDVNQAYKKMGFSAEVMPFVVNMGKIYGRADLLICRAGATTVAEVTALGKAAVFIPFAQAVGDHQAINARKLVQAGAAEMILEEELSPGKLAETIRRLLRDRAAISRMEDKAKELGNLRAAELIVDALYTLVEEKDVKRS